MRLYAGTSGYAYEEWRGSFYPAGLSRERMLGHYGSRLPAVEINHTFYRMPRRGVLEEWASRVPETFRFVLKASRGITHFKRLAGAEEETRYLLETASAGLGRRAGAILFQLPPSFAADVPRLDGFLASLPAAERAAFEFRHPSWFGPETYACLEAHGAALCAAETEEGPPPDRLRTAGWGYLRLRRSTYGEAELERWVGRIREQGWDRAYVFFKHEEGGRGPAFAERLLELARGD